MDTYTNTKHGTKGVREVRFLLPELAGLLVCSMHARPHCKHTSSRSSLTGTTLPPHKADCSNAEQGEILHPAASPE